MSNKLHIFFQNFYLVMSLNKFLHILHETSCNFKLSLSEVRDIESAVCEAVSAILEKGRAPEIGISKDEGETYTYGELFKIEEILPVGSFYEGTKICDPQEFDFNIKLDVGEISINQGCRPGRVQVTCESSCLKGLEKLDYLFGGMMEEALKTMVHDEKEIKRDSGILHLVSVFSTRGPSLLTLLWCGVSSTFEISVDIMPSVRCTDNFIEELGNDEHFPLEFLQLVKQHGCYLVPKPCSPKCDKCFHVSFAQAELRLIQSLDEAHRRCYRLLKWLLVDNILDTYKVKMAMLDHVYNLKCESRGCVDKCVVAVLESLLSSFNDLRLPTFFLRSSCVITKDGEGKARYLDYLVDASGLDVSTLPAIEFAYGENYSYKNYDWVDMFGWYEYQRRCLSLIIDILCYFSREDIEFPALKYSEMYTALKVFSEDVISGASGVPGHGFEMRGRPTTREWRSKVPGFSERVFIPKFSLTLRKIQAILGKSFPVPTVWFTPPIALCLPCPVMAFSQGSACSYAWTDEDRLIRRGAMCYFAELKGSSWSPIAFGKMSFSENVMKSFHSFMFHSMAKLQGGLSSQLVRGKRADSVPPNESLATTEEEIPDFEGPFYYNVRFDGRAFLENIVSRWRYSHALIHFLICRMLYAIYKHKFL